MSIIIGMSSGSNSARAQVYMHGQTRPKAQIIFNHGKCSVIDPFGLTSKRYDPILKSWEDIKIPDGLSVNHISTWNNNITALGIKDGKIMMMHKSAHDSWQSYPIEIHRAGQVGWPFCFYESDIPGLFFAMGVQHGFVQDDEASCCAWYRKTSDGRFELHRVIPIEHNGPIYIGLREDGRYIKAMPFKKQSKLIPMLDYPVRVPGAFIVVSWQAGILWIIKDGEFSPSRVIELSNIRKNILNSDMEYPPVILDIQPMPDGRILLARRSDDYYDKWYDWKKSSSRNNKIMRDRDKKTQYGVEPAVEIEWNILDSNDWKLEKSTIVDTDTIKNLKTERDAARFSFGFTTDGRFVCPWGYQSNESAKKNILAPSTEGEKNKVGRVGLGSFSPRPPTDPDVRD